MLKQLTIKVGEPFLQEIDKAVAKDPLVDSRTEWIKETLRDRIEKEQELEEFKLSVRKRMKAAGVKSPFLTKKEKDELFNELAKKHGLKKTRRGS